MPKQEQPPEKQQEKKKQGGEEKIKDFKGVDPGPADKEQVVLSQDANSFSETENLQASQTPEAINRKKLVSKDGGYSPETGNPDAPARAHMSDEAFGAFDDFINKTTKNKKWTTPVKINSELRSNKIHGTQQLNALDDFSEKMGGPKKNFASEQKNFYLGNQEIIDKEFPKKETIESGIEMRDVDIEAEVKKEALKKESEEIKEVERLKKKVEEARMAYAREERKMQNKKGWLKEVLGSNIDISRVDSVNDAQREYRSQVSNLLNHKLEQLEKKDLTPEEMKKEKGLLVNTLNAEEKIALYYARTVVSDEDVRSEAKEKRWKSFFKFFKQTAGTATVATLALHLGNSPLEAKTFFENDLKKDKNSGRISAEELRLPEDLEILIDEKSLNQLLLIDKDIKELQDQLQKTKVALAEEKSSYNGLFNNQQTSSTPEEIKKVQGKIQFLRNQEKGIEDIIEEQESAKYEILLKIFSAGIKDMHNDLES